MAGKERTSMKPLSLGTLFGGLVIAAAALFPSAATAAPSPCTNVCVVAPTGNDANSGTSLATAKLHIQAGIDAVSPGGTVKVYPGKYVENLLITVPVTLTGVGEGSTVVYPALSAPNPSGCGGSLCTGASNIILVRANGVKITRLVLDGDNPALTSGVNFGGADIDARNGIIVDYQAGVFNNLVVRDVLVRNIFLRGIYASSGGSFTFDHNRVTNVQADPASIAIFAFGGTGTMSENTVSWANDAISANHSNGIRFLDNTVRHSGSGVHTDNSNDGGGVADAIDGNTVSDCMPNGYGVWVFVPYKAPSVTNNTVRGCDVGLAAFGSGAAVTTTFSRNKVTGTGAAGTRGAYVSTTEFGFGDSPVTVAFDHNTFSRFETGMFVEETAGKVATVTAHRNSIEGNTQGLNNSGSHVADATCNWWGSPSGPGGAGPGTGNSVSANVTFSPWLTSHSLDGHCGPGEGEGGGHGGGESD